jgi:hypothetical protein
MAELDCCIYRYTVASGCNLRLIRPGQAFDPDAVHQVPYVYVGILTLQQRLLSDQSASQVKTLMRPCECLFMEVAVC